MVTALKGRSLISTFTSLLFATSGDTHAILSNCRNDVGSRLQHAGDAEREGGATTAACRPVMQKDLDDAPGKEMLMLTVEYPPGAVEHVHRHDAYAFIYVLEGTIVEQVRGGKEVTLSPGQTFFEGPDDVHTVGRNASAAKPARFVVVMLKKKGVDAVLPAD
jgi:quercetin dioxygenase-like cupin family protein